MPNKFYSLPKSVFEYYHAKIKDWVRAVLPTKTSDLTNDSDFLDQLALAGIIASNFSTSSTYAVGDYVLYNHTLYRCKTAISTAGAWDASKWDATKTQDTFQGSAPGLVPAAESGDADKVLKGDGTWGEAGSSVRVSYDSVTEELHMDFIPEPSNSVLIGGRWYHYVKIGNQLWLAENLDYKFAYNGGTLPIGGSGTSTNPHAWYYNNDETNYGIDGTYKCGLLYNGIAVRYLNSMSASLLPSGWHVPSVSEWSTLITTIGNNPGTKIKALNNSVTSNWPSGWGGTDEYEFNALPAGNYNGDFHSIGSYTHFWTSDGESGYQYLYWTSYEISGINNTSTDPNTYAYSLRLVKTLT